MNHDANEPGLFRREAGTKRILFIAVTTILFMILSALFWSQPVIEAGILIRHNIFYEVPVLLAMMKWITQYGLNVMELSFGLLILLTLQSGSQRLNQPVFLAVLLTSVIGGFAGDWLKELFDRARPAIDLAGQIANTYVSKSPSFPSGHAITSMGMALPFLFLAPQIDRLTRLFKVFILTMGILVCYSRIALQYHYVSDIAGSIAFISAFTLISLLVSNAIYALIKTRETRMKIFAMGQGLIFIALAVIYYFI
jgi:membrane-associated phospholipid phosphatase